MRSLALPVGIATGIGSLPHDDVDEAIRFVLDRQPRLPAAPSLPRRAGVEGMVAQAAWGITGVSVLPDGSLLVDEGAVDPAEPLTDLGVGGEPFVSLRAFLDVIAGRTAPFKVQITGPLTLGIALHACGVAAAKAFTIAGNAVKDRVREVLAVARAAAPEAPLVMFLDEPGLTAALDPSFPFRLDDTLDLVSAALAVIEGGRAIAGLHCCGRADWAAVLQAGPQIVSVPIGAGAVDHTGAFVNYIEAGGWVAWGAVPTDRPLGESADLLWRRLTAEWDALVDMGCDPALIVEQAMVTPACGLATVTLPYASRIIDLTADLARRIEDHALGMGVDLGA
jgi:methionine synthase II (cobalamin-independent)